LLSRLWPFSAEQRGFEATASSQQFDYPVSLFASSEGCKPKRLSTGQEGPRDRALQFRARASDALAEHEKIEIDDEELGARVAAIVTQSGRTRDRAAEFYRSPENREALRQSMRREKALDFILSRAKRENAASEPK